MQKEIDKNTNAINISSSNNVNNNNRTTTSSNIMSSSLTKALLLSSSSASVTSSPMALLEDGFIQHRSQDIKTSTITSNDNNSEDYEQKLIDISLQKNIFSFSSSQLENSKDNIHSLDNNNEYTEKTGIHGSLGITSSSLINSQKQNDHISSSQSHFFISSSPTSPPPHIPKDKGKSSTKDLHTQIPDYSADAEIETELNQTVSPLSQTKMPPPHNSLHWSGISLPVHTSRPLSKSFASSYNIFDKIRRKDFGLETEDEEIEHTQFMSQFRPGSSPPSIPLTPFTNQVGGHASFLRFSEKVICKPLVSSEKQFYEIVDKKFARLKKFMATYLGLVNITFIPCPNSIPSNSQVTTGNLLQQSEDQKQQKFSSVTTTNTAISPALSSPNYEKYLSYSTAEKRISSYHGGTSGHVHNMGGVQEDDDDDDDWALESTPMLVFDHNKHLFALEKNSDTVSPSTESSTNLHHALREFLSPENLRLRFTQYRDTVGAIRRRHSLKRETRIKSHESLPDMLKSVTLEDAPIFQMSDDEIDTITSIKETAAKAAVAMSQDVSLEASVSINPWSLHLYKTQISKMQQSPAASRTSLGSSGGGGANPLIHPFVLLEDLTCGLSRPCILDLKMGTRQHGVNSSLQKRLSQERKCEKSTSKSLGVRICGMQVYNHVTKSYTYLDKYKGRKINVANFKQHILSFLDNGEYYLLGYLPGVIEKLKELYSTIESLDTCRFYASSLLILYDSDWIKSQSSNDATTATDFHDSSHDKGKHANRLPFQLSIRMIDFAHSVHNVNLLRPIQSDINMIIPSSLSTHVTTTNSVNTTSKVNTNATQQHNGEELIYVSYPPTTKGPDNGYLLGLKSLINCFEEIQSDFGGILTHVKKDQVSREVQIKIDVC